MKFKILLVSVVLLFVSAVTFAGESILYISDNTHMSDSFSIKSLDMLQTFIDDDFGKDKVNVSNVSRFDMNTTQCLELFDSIYRRGHQDAIVLMIGDSNYHNLYGFSKYMKSVNLDRPITIKSPKNVSEVNNEMLKLYAVANKSTLTNIVSTVYNKIMGSGVKNSFVPKVVPNFYVLNSNFKKDDNVIATLNTYRYAWSLIKQEKYEEAKAFLIPIIESKPSQSMLYYALGSAYLSENSKDCELKALQCFEDGVLVDPLNKENICYKGLVLMYMLYKGDITSEVLFFARGLNEFITFPNDELESILAINTTNHDEKVKVINNWIISDMDKLKNKAIVSNTKLIFSSYPDDIPINKLIADYVKNASRVLYIDNKIDSKENADFIVYRFARKLYDFLKEHKIFKI